MLCLAVPSYASVLESGMDELRKRFDLCVALHRLCSEEGATCRLAPIKRGCAEGPRLSQLIAQRFRITVPRRTAHAYLGRIVQAHPELDAGVAAARV